LLIPVHFAEKLSHYDINDIIIPLNFYADEFQINNAIGAHVLSICGCPYFFQLCFNTTTIQSTLDFIFPFANIPSQVFKEIDNDVVLYQIYQVLEELENEIRVKSHLLCTL